MENSWERSSLTFKVRHSQIQLTEPLISTKVSLMCYTSSPWFLGWQYCTGVRGADTWETGSQLLANYGAYSQDSAQTDEKESRIPGTTYSVGQCLLKATPCTLLKGGKESGAYKRIRDFRSGPQIWVQRTRESKSINSKSFLNWLNNILGGN